jgi:hypothetical protein
MALKGQELLSFLDENKGVDRDELIERAGYCLTRNGKVSLKRTKFFEALASANGHEIGATTSGSGNGTGKVATYRLKVGPNGMVPVSRAYTDQCEMQPGSYVKVVIEDGCVILEPDTEGDATSGEGESTDKAKSNGKGKSKAAPLANLAAVA